MKDKKILKKWWFWVIVALVVLGAIGSLGQTKNNTDNAGKSNSQETSNSGTATLPKLNADDYIDKEGLVVYKDLQNTGYKVDAEFEKQALTEMNGKASVLFESLDQNKSDDKLSVDAYVVGDLTQDGDNVKLTIVLSPKS
ncbi:MAG: hypothetical protein WBI29_00965 [Candidatus Saccharimonadales bacterium]